MRRQQLLLLLAIIHVALRLIRGLEPINWSCCFLLTHIAILFIAAAGELLVLTIMQAITLWCFNLHTTQLQLLASGCVGLIHLMLDLTHTFSLLNTILLSLLVPAPFVDLTLTQDSLLRDHL